MKQHTQKEIGAEIQNLRRKIWGPGGLSEDISAAERVHDLAAMSARDAEELFNRAASKLSELVRERSKIMEELRDLYQSYYQAGEQ